MTMTAPDMLRIVGVPGSPYSRKLRAVLRYRRIPHAWVTPGSPESRDLPAPRVQLLPQLVMPGDDGALEARTDTTPLIRLLEASHPVRSVVPPDPPIAFVDALVEDYADEWLTKAMFHYRWAFADDAAHAAAILPRWFMPNQPDERAQAAGAAFAERQVGRLGVVGSNDVTAPVIEESYERLLRILDARLTTARFLLGDRPARGDFALFGQLTQLVGFDPTPAAIALRVAPRVVAWVDLVEDLSGLEAPDADWIRCERAADAVRPLLAEIGRVYVPFLVANAAALQRGAALVECEIDGRPWVQRPFPYQAKCLRWLREEWAALEEADRRVAADLLADTGCERLFDA